MKIIDAQNRTIGRVASEAAMALMGKDKANYKDNVEPKEKVEIKNASKARINIKKKKDKVYTRYTGFHSGLKFTTLGEMIEKKGYEEVFKKAVYGMLPNNRLRKIMMNNLKVTD